MRVADGYVQYSTDSGITWQNLIAVSELKGDTGANGSPVNWRGAWEEDAEYSKLDAVSYDGSSYIFTYDTHVIGSVPGVDEEWGLMARKGNDGANGVTPHIGDNGNWYIGVTDTGNPSRGATGAKGDPGISGQDGHSPVVTATKSGKTTTISVDGTAIAAVEDGTDGAPGVAGAPGKNGTDGHTPVKGTDYWTAADKQEIVSSVIAALPDGTEIAY